MLFILGANRDPLDPEFIALDGEVDKRNLTQNRTAGLAPHFSQILSVAAPRRKTMASS